MSLPVSVIVIAQNEAHNIGYLLGTVVGRFDDIVVVDSFSSDGTDEICREFDGVRVFQNQFEDWAAQRNWALENCEIKNDIVFFLDADEYLTPAFISELKSLIESDRRFDAISVLPEFVFMGKTLSYAYGHPYIRRIFRKTGLRFVCEGARERAISGDTELKMIAPFIHHDRKDISSWIAKHVKNAEREAAYYGRRVYPQAYSEPLKRRTWLRTSIWNRLPLLIRPFMYWGYRYLFRFGFLDAKAGWIYCFLHAFWYQFLIDVLIIERKLCSRKAGNDADS
ncbi:MAG TPA: glycosyltransferase family 2 protein [Spirochaetota bacterium]|nr:glycosyltransferase family 2 protein [Spirochaetota bacterium]